MNSWKLYILLDQEVYWAAIVLVVGVVNQQLSLDKEGWGPKTEKELLMREILIAFSGSPKCFREHLNTPHPLGSLGLS